MSDWDGAEDAATTLDLDALQDNANALLDLVFTEDDAVIDSLPDDVEASLVPTLDILARTVEEGLTGADLVAAARLVRRTAQPYLSRIPREIVALIQTLPVKGSSSDVTG